MKSEQKTNAMRILDRAGIAYVSHSYDGDGTMTGVDIARVLGEDPRRVFKTLVTVGRSGAHFVFVIPVEAELDLKAAARSVGEKAVEMIPQKQLLPTTGYIHGGCSPIGMKKLFTTVVDRSAEDFDVIFFSAGKIGQQVEMPLSSLARVIPLKTDEITK